MNNIQTYHLEIFGDKYSLLSDESEDHVIAAAQMVDKYMRKIADNISIKNERRIAVLSAIRIASILLYKEASLLKQQRSIFNIIEGIESHLAQNDIT